MKIQSVSRFLVPVDRMCDYSPLVSTVSNFVNLLFIKPALWVYPKSLSKTSHYYTHIQEKSGWRCFFLLIPFIGNLGLWVYDALKQREFHKEVPQIEGLRLQGKAAQRGGDQLREENMELVHVQYNAAKTHFLSELKILKKYFGRLHPRLLECRLNINVCRSTLEHPQSMLSVWLEHISLLEFVFGTDDVRVNLACYQMGMCYFKLGCYAQAERFFERAEPLFRAPLTEDSPFDHIQFHEQFGICLARNNRHKDALLHFRQVESVKDLNGTGLLGEIGMCLTKAGEYREALTYLDHACQSFEIQLFGCDNLEQAILLKARGKCLRVVGLYDEALEDLERAEKNIEGPVLLPSLLVDKSACFVRTGKAQPQLAKDALFKARDLDPTLQDELYIAHLLGMIGACFNTTGARFNKAGSHFNAIEEFKKAFEVLDIASKMCERLDPDSVKTGSIFLATFSVLNKMPEQDRRLLDRYSERMSSIYSKLPESDHRRVRVEEIVRAHNSSRGDRAVLEKWTERLTSR